MDYDEQDHEVVRLLSKLKETETAYPADMMAARRHSFVKQIAALGIGTGAALAVKEGAKASGGSSIPPIASTIVETALIVAIVAEASFVAFMNREKVLDVFRTISGQQTVEQLTAPADSLPLLQPTGFVETAFTETAEPTVVTETPTALDTPSPENLVVTQSISESQDAASPEAAGVQVNSTPEPNGNNGNHYGQTPIPERTKETEGGGSDSNSNNDNNNNNNNNNDNNGNGNRNNH